jgi:hypothetical protein
MSTALQIVEDESSNDEPLTNRVQAKKPGVGSDAVPTGSRAAFGGSGISAKSSPRAVASRSALAAPERSLRDKRSAFSSPRRAAALVGTPSPSLPSSQASAPLYDEQTKLKSAFESVSKSSASKASAASGPRLLRATAAGSSGDFACNIGSERIKLSSTLRDLSQNHFSSATSKLGRLLPQTNQEDSKTPSLHLFTRPLAGVNRRKTATLQAAPARDSGFLYPRGRPSPIFVPPQPQFQSLLYNNLLLPHRPSPRPMTHPRLSAAALPRRTASSPTCHSATSTSLYRSCPMSKQRRRDAARRKGPEPRPH